MNQVKVNILIIGDELLLGKVADINTSMIAKSLDRQGMKVNRVMTVGDDGKEIRLGLEQLTQSADAVITTGGLGPTKDDITKKVFADFTDSELVLDKEVLEHVTQMMEKRGRSMNDLTATQALLPKSCTPITNRCGTAPGMLFHTDDGKIIISMPGVPFEAEAMMGNVATILTKHFGTDPTIHHTLLLDGISESAVAERLAEWENGLPKGVHLAYLPMDGYMRLRLDCDTHDSRWIDELTEILSDHIFANVDQTPAELLLGYLIDNNLTVATAESCTGGNISAALTAIPGSSKAVKGAVVAYSNAIKSKLLNVKQSTLEEFGAVSEPTVREMAHGVSEALSADVALATSGIAGPGGGSELKPVGTVCLGIRLPDSRIVTATHHFHGNRKRITLLATNTALIEAYKLLKSL